MTDQVGKKKAQVLAENNSIATGDISISGNVAGNFHIGNSYGLSTEETTRLFDEILSKVERKDFTGECPYKGLDVFEEDDAELFFGREKLVDDLVSRVKDSRTVFVTGPSGSGKSSLVRAGLIHALKQGAIKGSDRWQYATMKPGRDPFESLANAFSRLKSPELGNYFRNNANQVNVLDECAESTLTDNKNQRLVLFIDQFEEVFTQISNEVERVAFLNLLTHAATIENGRVIILFSMRSDFVSNCATYPQLNALLNQQFVQIGAMQPEELVSAIAQPALRVGLRIDPDLIAQIINEMKGEPGALPLMQFALKDLFDSQGEKSGVPALTLNDYLERGGIHKALERHADDSFSKLSKNEQELARSIFSGLIEIGRGTQDTKRTALFDELVPANTNAEDVEAIVQKLADARLITTDEATGRDTVTISHEKLIDAWPWLKKLVNENRDVIALQNEISADAKEWEEHKHDASYLYGGGRLLNAREKLTTQKLVLSGLVLKFVQMSYARQRRGQIVLISGVSAVFILLIAAVIMFAGLTQEAQRQAKLAHVGELSAQSISLQDIDFQLSLLLSVEAYRISETVQSNKALLDNAQAHPQLRAFLNGHTSGIYSLAFSPNGKMLASGSRDGAIILWDIATLQMIGQPLTRNAGFVSSMAFSPDGKTLVSGYPDKSIILWDVATHQMIGQPLNGHASSVIKVIFSSDGKTIASGSSDGAVILWDVATRQIIDQPLAGHAASVIGMAFSSNSKMLAFGSNDGSIIIWDVAARKMIGQPLRGDAYSMTFSSNDKILASGSGDGSIILWDVATHQMIGQPLKGHTAVVYSVAFSPDDKILASGSGDRTIILWDIAAHQIIGQSLKGHTYWVNSVTFSSDGTLTSGGEDNTIILWDVATTSLRIAQSLVGHSNWVSSLAFSPDGKMLASGSYDKNIILWDPAHLQMLGQPLTGHNDIVLSLEFSPDGRTLISHSLDETVIYWDIATRQIIDQLHKEAYQIYDRAYSLASKTYATISPSDYNNIILSDEAGQTIGLLAGTNRVTSVAFSPNGKTLASGSCYGKPASRDGCIQGEIILWDVNLQSWIEKSCQRVGRNFTLAEWEKYFPNEKYRATCPQFPLEPEVTVIPTTIP